MTKDVKSTTLELKPEAPVANTPSLDPLMMAAIQEHVKVAMKEAVTTIVAQLKPVMTVPVSPPSVPVTNAGAPRSSVPRAADSYTSKLKGIPVGEGEDLRHVHPNVISDWFSKVERRWQDNYNKKSVDGKPVSLSWTRGHE